MLLTNAWVSVGTCRDRRVTCPSRHDVWVAEDEPEAWQPSPITPSQVQWWLLLLGCLIGGAAFIATRALDVSVGWITAGCLTLAAVGAVIGLAFRSGVQPHTATVPIAPGLSDQGALQFATDALVGLGMRDLETTDLTIVACSPPSIATFGTRVEVTVLPRADGSVFSVTTQPNDLVLIDYGASKKLLSHTVGELSRRQTLRR